MDTNRLKRFATEARNILIGGVVQRLAALGFQPDGTTTEQPELMDGGAVFMGEVQSEDFYHQWMSLQAQVQRRSFREVAEEAAYTWFNRLVAIRIMAKNELVPAVLEYESDEVRIPVIVTEARQGRLPQMDEAKRQKTDTLLQNDALTDEQFALLIVAYCHSNPIIQKSFGSISDYTELLLPGNILKSGGFIDRLNADDYITDADYRSPELIGWLYQFYISERKDEVFAKKGKFEADEIPAATQIFTPDWIVKYMVQNTVGRIYLDNNPYSGIKEGMKFLVEPAEPTPVNNICQLDDICDLKVADLACGSGHILNECFDLLYRIYMEEGYNRKQAVENIFRHNLTGVDIDARARQLATFALLMKACQRDKSFTDGHCMPKVISVPPRLEMDDEELAQACLDFVGGYENVVAEWLEGYVEQIRDADSLGSIIKFDMDTEERAFFQAKYEDWAQDGEDADDIPKAVKQLMPYVKFILALTEQYDALVMNPPYMGGGNMNSVLSKYVKDNYGDSKADLFSVFMEVCIDRLQNHGKYGMINMQSWMFLSSFEKLRKQVLDNYCIESMLHLGPRTFDELSGEVVQNTAFVISKHTSNMGGTYFRLVDGKNCADKERMFLQVLEEHTAKIYYPNVPQKDFKKIPGCPIGYWVSKNIIQCFSNKSIKDYTISDGQNITANNDKYLRTHWEVSKYNITSMLKWKPYAKGGSFRKWYGNMEYMVDWSENARTFYHKNSSARIIPEYLWNREGISWTLLSSNNTGFRLLPSGATFDKTGSSIFCKNDKDIPYIMSLLNSKLSQLFLNIFSSTMAFQIVEIQRIPLIDCLLRNNRPQQNISISKLDWDAHETSWDFRENELLRIAKGETAILDEENLRFSTLKTQVYDAQTSGLDKATLQEICAQYKKEWETFFMWLHANEEELNRQFIDIYGLQDELTPDVPLDEITILQQGEISIENEQIVWHDDVIIKQLISYAVGCLMGRYSIDRPGLILANQGDGKAEYEALVPNSRFAIDDDGIIPLMSVNNELTDHITLRFKTWLGIAFGEDTLMENLNFVEQALGKRLEDYFLKDFWKEHKKMYQNRPIYWLFSSKKGAFQCIVYMHRMNAYTAEKIRTGYLLPHIEWLMARQQELQDNAASLSARERKEMDNIGKQITECREYHDRLHVAADQQIAFDLDDGVVVNYAKFGDVLAKLK